MQYPQSFDQIAYIYDDVFSNSPIGRLQRQRVHSFLGEVLSEMPNKKVLELNCGTGIDAIWLAQNACQVTATDLSSAMLRVTQQKVEELSLEKKITTQQLSIDQLESLEQGGKYDLIFSNFGGFNCLDPKNMAQISKSIAAHLHVGGHFIAVVMTNFCLWETLYFMAKFSFRKAFRRRHKKALSVPIGNGESVDTWYYSPDSFYYHFSKHFKKEACFPVGLFIPPSYLTETFRNHPNVLQKLNQMEKKFQHFSFANKCADHFYIHLTKL